MEEADLTWGSCVRLGLLSHVEIMREVGLEAAYSRCLGYGEGASSLKEQGFCWAPGTEVAKVEYITSESDRCGFKP